MPFDLIFMGNGPFAVPALAALSKSHHRVRLVVARPDRPQGKHLVVEPGPVAKFAGDHGLPLEQPESVNDPAYIARLTELQPDLLVVADFGQILSSACLAVARLGGINIHGSLLPKYRGAAPIAWAIYHGESETGVSLLQMTPVMDAGGVVAQSVVSIGETHTSATLEPVLADLGAELIVETLARLESGPQTVIPQDPAKVTKAPKLKKEDGRIHWQRTAVEISRQQRAMDPWPGVFSEWQPPKGAPIRLKIEKLRVLESANSSDPGTVLPTTKGELHVQTGAGAIAIEVVQPAGKASMLIADFLRGRPIREGEKLF